MGNAGLLTFFGNTDLTTTQHIAARLGETEVVRIVEGVSTTWTATAGDSRGDPLAGMVGASSGIQTSSGTTRGGGSTEGEQIQRVPLMQASEIVQAFSRERGNILVMIPDKPACVLHRCVHYRAEDDGLFRGTYSQIDGHKPPRTTRAEREGRTRNPVT